MRLASLSCFSSSNTMAGPSRSSWDTALSPGWSGAGVAVSRLETTALAGDAEPPSPSVAARERGVTGLLADELFQAGFGVVDAAARAFCHFLLALLGDGEKAVALPLLNAEGEELEEEGFLDEFSLLDDDAAGDAAGVA